MLAIVWPAAKLTFDVVGRAVPGGISGEEAALRGPVTRTVRTTALTPVDGTPPRPVTLRRTTPPASTGAAGRDAGAGAGVEQARRRQTAVVGAPSGTTRRHPRRRRWQQRSRMLTRPLVPTLATTRPEMDVPVEKLSDDEFGAAEAAGQTARLPSLLGRAAVTLSSTESTPDGGTTEVPVTARSMRPPGARRPVGAPSPYRVSRMRVRSRRREVPERRVPAHDVHEGVGRLAHLEADAPVAPDSDDSLVGNDVPAVEVQGRRRGRRAARRGRSGASLPPGDGPPSR